MRRFKLLLAAGLLSLLIFLAIVGLTVAAEREHG